MTVAALIVNPGKSFHEEFATQCVAHFGSASTYTRYERPFDDQHPRLRPDPDPAFHLVVIDLEDWATSQDPIDILSLELPAWVKNMIDDAAPQACIIILCPDRAVPAIRPMILALGHRPDPIVCPRSYGMLVQMTITEVIHREWKIWNVWQDSSSKSPPSGGGSMWTSDYWTRR